MFCEHCGNLLPDSAKFCDSCGAPVRKKKPEQPVQQQPEAPSYPQPYAQVPDHAEPQREQPGVSFADAIRLYFQGYANFSGRSRRSEFWYAALFTGLLGAAVTSILPDLASLLSLALLCPNLAIAVRRLHDTGKSGWYYLMSLIPIAGAFIILYQYCKDSEGDNQWGKSPKY